MKQKTLTSEERAAIKVLNFTATFDGVIINETDIIRILQLGIEKFIPKNKQHLVRISESSYPIKIVVFNHLKS